MAKNGMPSVGNAAAVELRDVWMIEAGEEKFFALKAANDVVAIHSAPNEFERGLAMQLAILRKVNIAHSAAPDEREDFVVANDLARAVFAIANKCFRREMQGRLLNKCVDVVLMFKQRFNFRAHRCIRSTFLIEKCFPTHQVQGQLRT